MKKLFKQFSFPEGIPSEKTMQLASQKDKNGTPLMTLDEAVEKVAEENK